MALKCKRLGEHYNTGTTNPHPYTPCNVNCIQYIIMRTEYKAYNIGGLTTGAGMAEPYSPPPKGQAVPGAILDEAPFLSIVDFERFAMRLSKVGAQVHQAGGTLQYGDLNNPHPYTPYKAKCIQYIITRTECKANNIGGLTVGAGMA